MIQQESVANFQAMMRAAGNQDLSVVSCTDAKGRTFEVLCILTSDHTGKDIYLPFGFMLSPSLYSLMNKMQPPENLKGEWYWHDD